MAAYGAVVSLVEILQQQQQLLLDPHHKYSLDEVKTLREKVLSFQTFFDDIFFVPKEYREDVKNLAGEIREKIYVALDTIESFLFNHQSQSLISSSEITPPTPPTAAAGDENSIIISMLEEIIQAIDPITTEAEKLRDPIKEYLDKRNFFNKDNRSANANTDVQQPSTRSTTTKIVGQDEYKRQLKEQLMNDAEDKLQVVSISGLPGIGKTTLAGSLYDDEEIKNHFNTLAWVTVSQDYHVNDIFEKLLSSMESTTQKAGSLWNQGGSHQDLASQVQHGLYQKKYLVVVDDMWDKDVWNKVKGVLKDEKTGSRIILTTRNPIIAEEAKSKFHLPMEPLNEEDSWTLLTYKIFGDVTPPLLPKLEELGKKIAKDCGGLPLSLVVIGGLLSQGNIDEEYWRNIGEDVYAAAQKGADSYKEILSLSYNHLPGHLKGCFLYMGAFPEDSSIFVGKLIRLWVAEGFLNPLSNQSLEQAAKMFLINLIDRNLVAVRKWSSDKQIKTCGMHDTLRDLAVQESGTEKFVHSIRKYAKELEEGAVTQRRVSVHRNVLICLEDVYNCVKTMTHARSLIYCGAHHHHPLPTCLTFDLLRVFDAYTVYFISFPDEVLKLIHLRYLALTYNGKLPSLMSKLEKLQVLIVRRQPKIIFVGASFLPNEIWNMSQLRHLILTETDLPNLIPSELDNSSTILLENLQTLSNVNAVSCTPEVLQNMPNLRKLGMWMESPGIVDLDLEKLQQLEAFKLTVLNPIPKPKKNKRDDVEVEEEEEEEEEEEVDTVPSYKVVFKPKLYFPKTLRKLTLSGCGLAWKDMEVIRQLAPDLEVLKLRELAFQGVAWDPEEHQIFRKLKYLLIEYLDFVYWGADHSHFPKLERFMISHCYNLEEMDEKIGEIGCLQLIEMVDCSPEAVKWAEQVKENQKDNKVLKVRIYTSWK